MYKKSIKIIALLLLLLAACSNNTDHQSDTVQGDIREETSGVHTLPAFLENQDEEIQLIYQAVAMNQNLLEQIPCYCGCGETVGHKDNYDCFIFDNKEDGSIIWDDHGTKCPICLDIAVKAMVDYKNGKSIIEIRKEMDQMYEVGYPEPTETAILS